MGVCTGIAWVTGYTMLQENVADEYRGRTFATLTIAARMVLFNSDGSRAEMSGNGIRCFAQALARRRGDTHPQQILTDAGDRLVTMW